MQKGGAVYIITNTSHTVLYTGVTSDLRTRVQEHIMEVYPKSFTARYNFKKLVWYELLGSIEEAIMREKQIKKRSRAYKESIITGMNPDWNDLWETIKDW
jgi:putative endonuclease